MLSQGCPLSLTALATFMALETKVATILKMLSMRSRWEGLSAKFPRREFFSGKRLTRMSMFRFLLFEAKGIKN